MPVSPCSPKTSILPQLSGLVRAFVWIFVAGTLVTAGALTAHAGCAFGHGIAGFPIPVSFKTGELPLRIYVEYSAGGLTYSLTPPAVPCEGPHCGGQSRMRPVGTIPWSVRLQSSTSTRHNEEEAWSGSESPHAPDRPRSVSAPRGSILPLDHPPKPQAL